MSTPSTPSISQGPLSEALAEILSYRELGPDWDSYGAQPIAETAVAAAEQLLAGVQAELYPRLGDRVRPFHVAPVPTGGVQLEWESEDGSRIEVEARPDGGFLSVMCCGFGKDRRILSQADDSASGVIEVISELLVSETDDLARTGGR